MANESVDCNVTQIFPLHEGKDIPIRKKEGSHHEAAVMIKIYRFALQIKKSPLIHYTRNKVIYYTFDIDTVSVIPVIPDAIFPFLIDRYFCYVTSSCSH
jgi:hypothetical protein